MPAGTCTLLWVANLARPESLLLPIAAGLTTYLASRLSAAAQPPLPVEHTQTIAMRRNLSVLYPLGLAISGHFAPAALVLYWVTGNLASAAQQWTINRFVLHLRGAPT